MRASCPRNSERPLERRASLARPCLPRQRCSHARLGSFYAQRSSGCVREGREVRGVNKNRKRRRRRASASGAAASRAHGALSCVCAPASPSLSLHLHLLAAAGRTGGSAASCSRRPIAPAAADGKPKRRRTASVCASAIPTPRSHPSDVASQHASEAARASTLSRASSARQTVDTRENGGCERLTAERCEMLLRQEHVASQRSPAGLARAPPCLDVCPPAPVSSPLRGGGCGADLVARTLDERCHRHRPPRVPVTASERSSELPGTHCRGANERCHPCAPDCMSLSPANGERSQRRGERSSGGADCERLGRRDA
jgi:hypothetical protein